MLTQNTVPVRERVRDYSEASESDRNWLKNQVTLSDIFH